MDRRAKWITIGSVLGLFVVGAYLVFGHRTEGTILGQSVNAAIDNLLMTGTLLLVLPVSILLALAGLLGTGLAILVGRYAEKMGRVIWGRVAMSGFAATVLIGLAVMVDRKIGRLQSEITDLREKLGQQRMLLLEATNDQAAPAVAVAPATIQPLQAATPLTPPAPPVVAAKPASPAAPANPPATATPPKTVTPVKIGSTAATKAAPKRDKFLFDVDGVPRSINSIFGEANVRPVLLDEATDVVEIRMNLIPAVAYMAIVNLRTPGLEVKVGGSLSLKSYTSEYARVNECTLAINGEAGASPRANSGLGVWRGNFMSAGHWMMKEDPANKRPFLSFDKQNNVLFTAMAAKDREIALDPFNVLWGRLDAVIDGTVRTDERGRQRPRTAMGIDKDGSHLYLLVVDGRQRGYSLGITRAEVGLLLKTFGATNGMLCDEGGSTCMWVKKLGGIINSPSDGEERPTYTHFGIRLHTN